MLAERNDMPNHRLINSVRGVFAAIRSAGERIEILFETVRTKVASQVNDSMKIFEENENTWNSTLIRQFSYSAELS